MVQDHENHQIPCLTGKEKSENSCASKGCCWVTNPTRIYSCIYPKYDFVPCFPHSDGKVLERTCIAKGCHWIDNPLQQADNPLLTKCFYPLNYKSYRTADVLQCFDEASTVNDRIQCPVDGDLNEMNCRDKGCCWQPVFHNKAAHHCYYPWNSFKKDIDERNQYDSQIKRLSATCKHSTQDLNNRFDCYPRGTPNEKTCNARGCCWNPSKGKEPSCFYPPNHNSYSYVKTIRNETNGMYHLSFMSLIYQNKILSPYPDDIESVQMEIVYETNERVRVKISDNNNKRYESPYPNVNNKQIKQWNSTTISDKLYEVEVGLSSFGFAIKRCASKKTLFDTRSVGGFIMSDQFLQISARLPPSCIIYGLGQVSKPLKEKFDWTTLGLFAQGQPSAGHPFYLCLEDDGKAHGVFLLNSNALEIGLQPTPAITYRATGGILDFYFFMGDRPSDVIAQYLDLIGKPHLPPYWAMGYQLYRQGHTNLKSVQVVVVGNRKYPMDVIYGDLLYLDLKSYPYDTAMFKHELVNNTVKYMSIVQPLVEATTNRSFIVKKGTGDDIFLGKLTLKRSDPDYAYFDFTNPDTFTDWLSVVKDNFNSFPFNGLYLENNEPFNALDPVPCPLTRWDDPPFVPKLEDNEHQELKHRTICMSAVQKAGVHYNLHNLYGISQAHMTYDVLKNLLKVRPFVLSKSTFAGSGVYSGYWLEYKAYTWDTLRQSITDMLTMNMFGVPMVGANAFCTQIESTDKELCARWAALGAFYPLSLRKTSEPLNLTMPSGYAKFTYLRYRLLPFLYTMMQKAHRLGETAVRPLFFEYPNDKKTYAIDDQFLWGDCLLIAPALKEGVTKVMAYVPKGLWYTYPKMEKVQSDGEPHSLSAALNELPMLIRGGSIIVEHDPHIICHTTEECRRGKFDIVAVLDPSLYPTNHHSNKGEFYWQNNGDTNDEDNYFHIKFNANDRVFQMYALHKPTNGSSKDEMLINSIKIHYIDGKIKNVRIPVLKKNLEFTHVDNILDINAAEAGLSFWNDYYIQIEFRNVLGF
uniref:Lysosomal alpha-glucosidase n=1 Tax=Cacopsylla melanoneura TaxID=428564 RepID=A0A8D8ZIZ7_9HEMI